MLMYSAPKPQPLNNIKTYVRNQIKFMQGRF